MRRQSPLLTVLVALCFYCGFTAREVLAGPITVKAPGSTGKPDSTPGGGSDKKVDPPATPPSTPGGGSDKDKKVDPPGGGGGGTPGGGGGGTPGGGGGGTPGGGGGGTPGGGGGGTPGGGGGGTPGGGGGGTPGGGGGGGAVTPICSAPTCVDLTTRGSSGIAAGALYKQIDPQPTGTGVIDPFLRLQAHGSETFEEGFGTSARPFEFDEKNPLGFTHDLLLSDVGVFTIGGVRYREFLLDVNESKGHDDELLSLDKLMIFESATGKRSGFPSLGTLIYDLDAGGIDRWIKLDYSLGHGSGSGDMAVYIRDDLFSGLDYVYLYSRFGDHHSVDAGFEEWWTREGESTTVPEPSVMLMLGGGFAAVMARRRGRR